MQEVEDPDEVLVKNNRVKDQSGKEQKCNTRNSKVMSGKKKVRQGRIR